MAPSRFVKRGRWFGLNALKTSKLRRAEQTLRTLEGNLSKADKRYPSEREALVKQVEKWKRIVKDIEEGLDPMMNV